MKTIILTALLLAFCVSLDALAQPRFSKREIGVNGFRNPSIGAEYRYDQLSLHAGYYPTIFNKGETTNFLKAGFTWWFMPVGNQENPSSFYAGASFLRGYNKSYRDDIALGTEAGFRWVIYKGLNFRIGVIGVAAKGKSYRVNPAPGIGYSFFFN